MAQRDRVLEYMRQYGSITPLDAIRDIGCYRLAARINELRGLGHDIDVERLQVDTRDKKTTTIAKYRLNERAQRSIPGV